MCCVEDEKMKVSSLWRYDLGDGVVIEEVYEEGYKYLGILERHDICQEKRKEKVQKKYYKWVRAVLKSKLSGGNVIIVIKIWAAATVWYRAGIINWEKGELDKIDWQKFKSVTYIVSSCSVLAANQCRKRHAKLGKKYTGSCARNLRLNVKTNGSQINQHQCWKITNLKYFGTLQSKQIRK